jgi:hypothetical protein
MDSDFQTSPRAPYSNLSLFFSFFLSLKRTTGSVFKMPPCKLFLALTRAFRCINTCRLLQASKGTPLLPSAAVLCPLQIMEEEAWQESLVAESHVPPHSNINSASVMPCNPDLFTSSLSCSIPDPSSINIDEFVASISKAPDAPLIRSPPSSSLASNSLVVGCSIQPAVAAGVSPSPIGKRSSARLAAKKKLKFGRNRNAIVKAQEILAAKLNNAAATQFQSSNALSVNGQVDLMEQLARHFIRPLTKDQMEAIMELAIQGKEKEGTKKKGRKVAPLKAPFIEAAERI